jgi:hypothetical protein
MGDITFQVSVSIAGDRKATIEASDPTTAQDAIALFAQRFGATVRPAAPAVPTPVEQIQAAFAPIADSESQMPICAVHQLPMKLVHGKRGPFWSCHEKNSDGSWCRYKPGA